MTPHISEYFDLDRRLLALGPHDDISLRGASENILATGAIGSGKSTGVLSNVTRALFSSQPPCGGICLTTKSEDVDIYLALAEECGRSADVILVDPHSEEPPGLNVLRYEDERDGPGAGQVENMVGLLSELQEVASRKPGFHDGSGEIWKSAAEDMLRATVSAVKLATGTVRLADIAEMIRTAPRRDEVHDQEFLKQSQCVQ